MPLRYSTFIRELHKPGQVCMRVEQEPIILVIEDDPSARRLIAAALRTLGSVLEAADAESADGILHTHTPDVICLDLSLPDTSGFEVCRRIRRELRLSHTRVLAVSGRTTVTDRALAREVGADDFLAKPFRVRELLKRVEVWVRDAHDRAVSVAAQAQKASLSTSTGDISEVRAMPNFDSTTKAAPHGAGEVARD